MEAWLTKLDPNNLTFAGGFFVIVLTLIWFLITQVWPTLRDKWIPAKLEATRLQQAHTYELEKESNSILLRISETLAKVSAQVSDLTSTVNALVEQKE